MSVGAVNKSTGDRIPTAGMPAIDDALSLSSTNPVQNAIITAALADKQDATDNNLQTTDKTVVGAINEHEGDISSLMSGLTNYQTQNDINLEVPNRVNLFDKDNKIIEYKYYDGTSWHDVSAGTWQTIFVPVIGGLTYTASGFPAQGGVKTVITTGDKTTVLADFSAADNNQTYTTPSNAEYIGFGIYSPNANYDSAQFELGSTATAYAPYIPSVESRIEKLENGDVYKINASGSVEISIDSGVYMYTTGRDAARFLTVGYIGYAWDGTPVVKTILSETNTYITATAGTGNKVTFANSSTNSSATLVVRKII